MNTFLTFHNDDEHISALMRPTGWYQIDGSPARDVRNQLDDTCGQQWIGYGAPVHWLFDRRIYCASTTSGGVSSH
ncbi:hypothetical protein NPIL_689931 [Nephila pilipes]|uniref:Uncharacterized protein n=1 Tax=Nephila pilipes TaxID=299642 RepID=A0A8X6MJZ5_NEPPI|nr:hypothetical protein NPIL_689931 [Nephila pilipes]